MNSEIPGYILIATIALSLGALLFCPYEHLMWWLGIIDSTILAGLIIGYIFE